MTFKQCSSGTKGLSVPRNDWLYHQQQPELLIKGRVDPYFPVVYAKFRPYSQILQQKMKLIRPNKFFLCQCEELFPFSVPSWQEMSLVWSSAAISLSRDALLHSLSYWCLLQLSSDLWLQQGIFVMECFLFFRSFSVFWHNQASLVQTTTMLRLNFSRFSWPCLHALSCCIVIDWLDNY